MKLFKQTQDRVPEIGDVVRITVENDSLEPESQLIDAQVSEFNKHVVAFNSLNVIDEQISKESYNFIDKGNYILYNEYIKSITSNLKTDYIPTISQETIDTLPTTALNHHIALEGFIANMWAKIKAIFSRIYNAIKDFFVKYFTRLGRLKNKIGNLVKVLSETDKNLQMFNLDKVPGGLASKYPFKDIVDRDIISEVYTNLAILVDSFGEISAKASVFAGRDILDKDFVTSVSKLKDEIKVNKTNIDHNKDTQATLGSIKKHLPFTEDGATNTELNKENKSLEKEAKAKAKEVENKEEQVSEIVDKETDVDMSDKKFEEAKKEFQDFLKTLETVLNKVKNKRMIKGKTITEIKVSEDSGIELEISEDKETPSGITLSAKEPLIKLLNTVLEGINKSEKLATEYGKINDNVIKNMNTVDKLISDLDKIPEGSLGKYQKLLNNKVKVRLNLAKTFFNNYNKICKNILEMTMDSGDGVVEYSVLSLKHFNK